MPISLDEKYSQLSKDLKFANKKLSDSGLYGLVCFLIGIIAFAFLVGIVNNAPPGEVEFGDVKYPISTEIRGLVAAIFALATIILGAATYSAYAKGKARKPAVSLNSAIIAYNAQKAVQVLVKSAVIHQDDRKAVRSHVELLANHISGWKTTQSPNSISLPVEGLADAIRSRMVPIILAGNKEQIESVDRALFDILESLDRGIKYEELNEFASKINTLPQVAPPESYIMQFLRSHDLAKPAAIGIGVGVFIGVTIYATGGNGAAAIGSGTTAAIGVTAIVERRIKKQ